MSPTDRQLIDEWFSRQDPRAIADLADLIKHGYGRLTLVLSNQRLTDWITAKHHKPEKGQGRLSDGADNGS